MIVAVLQSCKRFFLCCTVIARSGNQLFSLIVAAHRRPPWTTLEIECGAAPKSLDVHSRMVE